MKNDATRYLQVFSRISHPNFQSDLHKEMFYKAFVRCAKHYFDDPKSKHVMPLAHQWYEACFTGSDTPIRTTLGKIRSELTSSCTLETFLSNYFYIVLSYYTQSFYMHKMGWRRIADFTSAIDGFIEWSKTITFEPDDLTLFLTPEEQAIESLENLRIKKAKVTLLSTYQGVPLQYKASVVHTTEKSVYLKAHPLQEAAAREQRSIYVIAENAEEYDLFAQVKVVRYRGHTLLELTHFTQLKENLYRRQNIRVQPKKPVPLHIRHNKITYKMQLFDLSLGGLAVITTKKITLEQYASVTITIPEVIFGKALELEASLVHQSRFESSEKFHFRLSLNASQERLLSQYVVRREQEIIQGLKQWG